MTVKDQWDKIKDNWLIILVLVVVLGIFMFSGSATSTMRSAYDSTASLESFAPQAAKMSYGGSVGSYAYESDFAPEVAQRIITKTASMQSDVERGKFKDAESKLLAIVKTSDSYLLNQNVNNYGTKLNSQYSGYYQIKVSTEKYDAVVQQIKELGEVKSFNENAQDITGQYTDIKTELEAEKERLLRYQKMYSEAVNVEDKINLNDRIFNQQRTVKYLEDAIKNMDNRVSYSTLYVTLNEKQSTYAGIALVKFGTLVKTLVSSFNSLLSLIFVALPYAAAALIIWLVVRFFKKRK